MTFHKNVNRRIEISKGLVSKGLGFSVLILKKIRVKEGSPVLILGSSKGVVKGHSVLKLSFS